MNEAAVYVIRFGGSHRKYEKQYNLILKLTGTNGCMPLRVGMGSKFYDCTRELNQAQIDELRAAGCTIKKK
jgi:hypothetical protein